jgi:hypothetical protein
MWDGAGGQFSEAIPRGQCDQNREARRERRIVLNLVEARLDLATRILLAAAR